MRSEFGRFLTKRMWYISLMKATVVILLLFCLTMYNAGANQRNDTPPAFMMGKFKDDYQIKYTINDTLWIQEPRTKFHIIKWNTDKQYLIARNDAKNPGDANLYTRIDYMTFKDMGEWKWGYCLTAYKAETNAAAEATAAADHDNPKKGCGGYPFSRMMVVGN